MGRVTERRRVLHIDGGVATERPDTLAGEEPLEIRVGGRAIAVTMRTPGDDFDLVAGFAWTEGLIADADHLVGLRYCAGADDEGLNTYNVIDLVLSDNAPRPDVNATRTFYTTSSCGVCGKASIAAIKVRSRFELHDDRRTVTPTLLSALPGKLRDAQKVFDQTGGLHAAALFSPDGDVLA